MASAAVKEKQEAWIESYNELVDSGLTNAQIADRMRMTVEAYQRRINRYGCRQPTRVERECLRMIRTWVKRNERFTLFDFPEWVPYSEKQLAIRFALDEGLIVKLGRKMGISGHSDLVYGPVGAPERKPRLNLHHEWLTGEDGY